MNPTALKTIGTTSIANRYPTAQAVVAMKNISANTILWSFGEVPPITRCIATSLRLCSKDRVRPYTSTDNDKIMIGIIIIASNI